jgi:hypothetical protein
VFDEFWNVQEYLRFRGLFRFFQHLLELPSSTQKRILQCWNNIEWVGGFYPKPEGMTETTVLQKVALEALWLLKEIQEINKDLQSLKVYNDEVLFEDEFEIEDHRIECTAWHCEY